MIWTRPVSKCFHGKVWTACEDVGGGVLLGGVLLGGDVIGWEVLLGGGPIKLLHRVIMTTFVNNDTEIKLVCSASVFG